MIINKIKSFNFVWRIIYIFSFKSSLKYRFWYIIWEIVKMFRLITGKKLKPYFPKNLYWDYIIRGNFYEEIGFVCYILAAIYA